MNSKKILSKKRKISLFFLGAANSFPFVIVTEILSPNTQLIIIIEFCQHETVCCSVISSLEIMKQMKTNQ